MKEKLLARAILPIYRSTRGQATLSGLTSSSEEYEAARPYSQIPSPRGYPIIGNMLEFTNKENVKNFTEYHGGMKKNLGNIYKFKMPGPDILFICDPEDARKLLSQDGAVPFSNVFEPFELMRKGPLKDLVSEVGLMGQGEDWSKFRQAVQQDLMRPASALFYIDELSDVMDEVIAKFEERLNAKREISGLQSIMNEFALEAVGIMFIGTKLGVLQGTEEGQRMIKSAQRVFELFIMLLAIPQIILPYTSVWKESVEHSRIMAKIVIKNVSAAIEKDKQDGSLAGTVLEKLIAKCGKDSDVPVIMSMDALGAGIETTGNQGTLLLYHLAANPEKQEKLSQEIREIIGSGGKMTAETLSQMRYLKACMTESQRIAPVATGTARKTKVDMVLGGYQIPKNTLVMRHGALNSVDPKYFHNPDHFIPERWIRGSAEYNKVDAFANLPFGHGPRACIGQRFARMELYMLAFKTIQKYKLEYHGSPIKIDYTGLGHADRDVNIKFIQR